MAPTIELRGRFFLSIQCIDITVSMLQATPMSHRDQYLQIRTTATEKAAIKHGAARAGMDMSRWVLDKVLPAPRCRFQERVKALAEAPENRRFILAELNDFLSGLDGTQLAAAVAEPPAAALDDYMGAYVAAMVETAAHRQGAEPPAWTAAVPALAEPVFASTLPGLRLHLLTHSPPPFRRRNIFIDSSIGDRV